MTKEKLEQAKLNFVKQNLELYQQNRDVLIMYDKYIRNIVELFDFIKKNDNDFFYTIVFAILVEIGFFSSDRKFNTDVDTFNELHIKPGINIIYGTGVCRNIACFYEDVFKYFYDYPLKLCCFSLNGEKNEDTIKYGNHVISLTKYEDITYGFDLLNHCVFKAKDSNTLKGLDYDCILKHTPSGDLLLELTSSLNTESNYLNEIIIKRELLDKAAKNDILSPDKYRKLIIEANNFISERKKILQSFMLQNEELTHEIKKKMLLLK